MITKFNLFEINNNDIQNSTEYKNRVDNVFDDFRNKNIKIKFYDNIRSTNLNIKTVFNNGSIAIYISSNDDSITLNGYKEGTGQGLKIKNNTSINEDYYSFFIKLIKTVERYTKWDEKYTISSIDELKKHLF